MMVFFKRFQKKCKKILVLHGPNLNLLGEREVGLYGRENLKQLNHRLIKACAHLPLELRFFQRNGEGQLIDLLHRYRHWADGMVFNPAAYTHSSYALRDAVAAIQKPTIEVHLTDLHRRSEQEPFRGVSVIAPVCVAQIMGEGWYSYRKAIDFLYTALQQ